MTTAAPLVYYPQYCFHLSPTINTWCPLRAVDIAGLESRPGFEDIDVFFYLNHPIRWVRITGVVVAIDDYYGHRVYTVDDSTGKCMECVSTVPIENKSNYRTSGHDKATEKQQASTTAAATAAVTTLPSHIDVGMTVDVKGSVKLFRGQRQIKIQKIAQILSTNQEVLFWNKIRDFRRDALSQPWVLKDREVRRCRKLQQVEAAESSGEKANSKYKERTERAGMSREGKRSDRTRSLESRPKHGSNAESSATASKTRNAATKDILKSRTGHGKRYDALGL